MCCQNIFALCGFLPLAQQFFRLAVQSSSAGFVYQGHAIMYLS